ncbi:MAG: LytTR family DNA-binding domain-containing protein [Bacteroidota bacterium]
MKMRSIVVDDSLLGIEIVVEMIKQYELDLEVVGTAQSVDQAFDLVIDQQPELILLDIEMPGGDGFSLLEKIAPLKIPLQVIFITAFDQYAIKAFRFCAVDYLLKPIEEQDLRAAIAKARKNLHDSRFRERYQHLVNNHQTKDKNLQKLAVPTIEGYHFVAIQKIVRCESEGNYIRIFTQDEKNIFATRRLKDIEDLLIQHRFVRIHRSHLINLDYLVHYQRGKGGRVRMSDGTELNVARSRKEELLNMLGAN